MVATKSTPRVNLSQAEGIAPSDITAISRFGLVVGCWRGCVLQAHLRKGGHVVDAKCQFQPGRVYRAVWFCGWVLCLVLVVERC